MKRILTLILMLVLCVFAICSCSDTAADPVTSLTKSAKEIAAAVQAGAEFPGATFVASDEMDADLVLMFNYAIETDEMINAIEDYVLSTQTQRDNPTFFSVIRVKEGTDPAIITAMAEALKTGYPKYNIEQMNLYNTDGLPVAEGYTLKTYDNGIIVTAYNENGNNEIIALAEDACRAD